MSDRQVYGGGPVSTTYEERRTDREKAIDAEVLARVKRGLAWLEETHGPGWEDKIDLAILDIADSKCCVLGQVYREECGDGNTGFSYADDTFGDCDVAEMGFDKDEPGEEWASLQEAWEFVLTPRVAAP